MQYYDDFEAQAYFRRAYGDEHNMMTPCILYQQMHGKYAIELSTDDHRTLFGVTVLIITHGQPKRASDLSMAFSSNREASDYVTSLAKDNT
jgi:hypothetical protein